MLTPWGIPRGAHRLCLCILFVCAFCTAARGHFFVDTIDRVADSPPYPGTGWQAEVWLDLPESAAGSLIAAEAYLRTHPADFTFRTAYVDFPPGPADSALDSELATIGAFLGDDISQVSDPAQLNRPMGHCVIRFAGLINVCLADSTLGIPGLPVLLDFGTQGYGGYRTRIGVTSIYRVQGAAYSAGNPFFTENALVQAAGLFPIEVTYLNRHAPTADNGDERAGVELYSWHPDGLPWPAGQVAIFPGRGAMTITPPHVVYQPDELPPAAYGDVDADGAVTLRDYQTLQQCAGGSTAAHCAALDAGPDGAIDAADLRTFVGVLSGPAAYAYLPGDFNADRRVDLDDYRWLQRCQSSGGGGDDFRATLPAGCSVFDRNADARVDVADFLDIQPFWAASFAPPGGRP